MLVEHSNDKKYICGYCDNDCLLENCAAMENHIREMHPKEMPTIDRENGHYICAVCSKAVVSISALKRHVSYHDPDRPYLCGFPKCSWAFRDTNELMGHRVAFHSKKLECPLCQKIFDQPHALR